jgi:hypothetical protein
VQDIAAPPLHPFANIPEAQYTPPLTRNFAAPVDREKATKDKEPQVVEDVYLQSKKALFITLSTKEILALSSEYRQKICDSVTPK